MSCLDDRCGKFERVCQWKTGLSNRGKVNERSDHGESSGDWAKARDVRL